jgi:hypothetical protein
MKTGIFTLLVVVASLRCWAGPAGGQAPIVIGQPSIFWHNGEWQTYKDGGWTPYRKSGSDRSSQSRLKEGTAYSGHRGDKGTTWREGLGRSAGLRHGFNSGIGTTTIGIGQPNGIGQSARGMGEPNVGIGRRTIGIGQPNVAIGQRNGIGQTTIGIGQPNVAIGQPNGIGQTTIGIGKPNAGIGQPNSIGQTTIGIGKPASFPNQKGGSGTDTAR